MASSAVGINFCPITAEIKTCKAIMKKTHKKYKKILLLGKDKLNTIEVLISKDLIDWYISHDEFVSINNMLRKFYEMKEEITNYETSSEHNT